MTFLRAFVTLLIIGLYVQAPAQGALTRLRKLTRKILVPNQRFQLIAEYEGGYVPVRWEWKNEKLPAITTAGKTVTTAPQDRPRWDHVILQLGDTSTQFVEVVWFLDGYDERSVELNFDTVSVTPGFTVEYTAGQSTNVYLKVKVSKREDGPLVIWPVGKYLIDNNATFTEVPLVITVSRPMTETSISTTVWTFYSAESIVGYFTGKRSVYSNADSSPFQSVEERTIITVHKPGGRVPFEYGQRH